MSSGEILRFGKYRLMQKIAAGGMGEVHLAKLKGPSGFEKLVVIKRLLDHRQKQQKYIDMFFSEARVAAQLNHSNIVQIYEVGNYEGVHYIAMEYVQGKSLRRIIDATHDTVGLLPAAYTINIITELCRGLSFAHEARHLSGAPMGLIHRDINPHNVLVSYLGEVKVIDFGIAKSELTLEQTQAGTIKGTVVYMSPEQSSGHKLDKRSDLFSVGICLYEALTGVNPFHKDTLTASLEAIRHCIYPPLTAQRPELAPFAPIVTKALARVPADRYNNCSELAEQLLVLQSKGVVPKPAMSLSAYLRTLFADDIAEEERLLSQTELAEMPLLGATESITSSPPQPQPVTDDKTVMDNPPAWMAKPTEAMPAHMSSAEPEVSSSARRHGAAEALNLADVLMALWRRPWMRWALLSAAVLATYSVLWVLLRPSSTQDIPHTVLPVPPGSVPHPQDLDATAKTLSPTQSLSRVNPPTDAPTVPAAPQPSVTRSPMPPEPAETADAANRRRRTPNPHRHVKPRPGRPEALPEANIAGGMLQFHVDPPLRMTMNGSSVGSSLRLRASAGTLKVGTGSDPITDPFAIQLHYSIENKQISFAVDSEPYANVLGAGGISLGRTPVQGIAGSTVTVFELRNPKVERSVRLTVRFLP